MKVFATLVCLYLVGAIATWCALGSVVHAEPQDGAPPMTGFVRVAAAIWWPVFWLRNLT